MTLLNINKLTVEYPLRRGVFKAVSNASLTVNPGEIHGLVGESGAGKSTIGSAVMGLLERPGYIAEGTISFRSEVTNGLDTEAMNRLRGKKISMVFQDPLTSLNPLINVGEQLYETMITHLGVSKQEAYSRARALLERVGIAEPDLRLKQYPHQYSGGMRQRVVIALALCSEPDVIIADEPTTALDVAVQAQILELIKDLAVERQVGVILITHDMGVIADTTDRVTVMYQGEVVECGDTSDVMGKPQHEYTKSLIAAVPRPQIKLKRFSKVSYDGNVNRFAIEEIAQSWPKIENRGDEPLLRVKNLKKQFIISKGILPSHSKWLKAVDNVAFDIMPGEVFGLVGESGSGKSTVARLISGLYPLDSGDVEFAGNIVSNPSDKLAQKNFRREIQMIFQDPYSSLNPRMRVLEIIAEPIRHHNILSGSKLKKRVHELLDQVGLGAVAASKYPHEFSGGQRQRISIARALATQPRFLICDEPTSALDVSIQAQILNILKDLQEHLGLTMLFISHDLPVVRQMCDRVAVMQGGRLLELQQTDALFSNPQTSYTQELLNLMPHLDGLSEEGLEIR